MPVVMQLMATRMAHVHQKSFFHRLPWAKAEAAMKAQTTWKDGNAAVPE
jgi:hypothetical protein